MFSGKMHVWIIQFGIVDQTDGRWAMSHSLIRIIPQNIIDRLLRGSIHQRRTIDVKAISACRGSGVSLGHVLQFLKLRECGFESRDKSARDIPVHCGTRRGGIFEKSNRRTV